MKLLSIGWIVDKFESKQIRILYNCTSIEERKLVKQRL